MDELKKYLEAQADSMQLMFERLEKMNMEVSKNKNVENDFETTTCRVPWPLPLEVEIGDIRENFEIFQASWNDYCVATGMSTWDNTKDERKARLMLSAIGTIAKKKYADFGLTDEDKRSENLAFNKIRECIIAKSNVIYDRYLFNTCVQQKDESFEFFLIRIKKLIKQCNYGEIQLQNELLRDKIVVGTYNPSIKKKLMEISDLTLEKAIDICKIAEVTTNQLSVMKFEDNSVKHEVHKIQSKPSQSSRLQQGSSKKRRCKFCSTWHAFEKGVCPALGKFCSICNKKNHLEEACFRNKKKHKSNIKEINFQQQDKETEQYSEESLVIATIDTKLSPTSTTVNANLNLKFGNVWKKVNCMLDTGANSCLMGIKQYQQLMGNQEINIDKSKRILVDFNGNPIDSVGEVKIECQLEKKFILLFQIIHKNHGPLLSARACSTLKLITYDDAVNQTPLKCQFPQVIEVITKTVNNSLTVCAAQEIVRKYDDVFQGLGQIPGEVELEINDEIKPVIQRARRIPVAYTNKLKVELDRLENENIIRKVNNHTEWVSNILIVQKPNSFRICLDPIPLNAALRRPNYQFSTIDEILPELGNAKVFTTCDAAKGFWQVKLTNKSSDLTCFWTPFGRYAWMRMPFGISSAPEIFQMKMYEIAHDLKGVEVLADDFLVFGCGDNIEEATKDHNKNLENLFIRLREYNLKLNKSKLKLCQNSVKFYGHILTSEGLKPDESKIAAIQNMDTPRSKADLQRFLGMVTYLSKFIKNLSTYSCPLRKLALDKSEWKWTENEEIEFKQIKALVANIKTLKYFETGKPITIECDSSSNGLGAALLQENKIIAYASRTLTSTERNYAQIEKELLAIVFACVRFDQMIVGHKCLVKTDHKPLIQIFKKPLLKAPKRLQLMLMILQRYSIQLEFIEGKNNILADALSRIPLIETSEDTSEITKSQIFSISEVEKQIEKINLIIPLRITDERVKNIKEETIKDQALNLVIKYIRNGWPRCIKDVPDIIKKNFKFKNDLSTQEDLIFMGSRILIPYSLRKLMIEKIHISHNGVENTLKLARENLFWPGMNAEIKDRIKDCYVCLKYSDSQRKPEMESHHIPNHPFQVASMDVFFTKYRGKNEKFLITVCHYSTISN